MKVFLFAAWPIEAILADLEERAHEAGLLDRIAERCVLITHDSDAPKSKRLCYIGVDNYEAPSLPVAMMSKSAREEQARQLTATR